MTDDLIEALRLQGWNDAADCIEKLELELYEMNELYGSVKDGLEEKLAKAMEMGNSMASFIRSHYIPSVAADWEEMLAELEGGEEAAVTAWKGRE